MAIAVLMPQDCLTTSKSRHKTGFSQALHPRDSAYAKHGALQASLLKHSSPSCEEPLKRVPPGRREWIVKMDASASHGHNTQKEDGGRKAKVKKPAETRGSMNARSASPALTIFADPKSREVAEEVFGALSEKANGHKALDEHDVADLHNGACGGPLDLLEDKSRVQLSLSKKAAESNMAAYKPKTRGFDTKVVAPRHLTVVSDRVEQAYWSLEDRKIDRHHNHAVVGAASSVNFVQSVNGDIGQGGSLQLRRASTDPQIVKHIVGHRYSEAIDIPWKTKSYHFPSSTSMSCPERWAGPAYSASPPPSSLPLPKFPLPKPKMLSRQSSSSVIEQNSGNMVEIPVVPNMVTHQVSSKREAMDVALATKSLRRMLKLDPF